MNVTPYPRRACLFHRINWVVKEVLGLAFWVMVMSQLPIALGYLYYRWCLMWW